MELFSAFTYITAYSFAIVITHYVATDVREPIRGTGAVSANVSPEFYRNDKKLRCHYYISKFIPSLWNHTSRILFLNWRGRGCKRDFHPCGLFYPWTLMEFNMITGNKPFRCLMTRNSESGFTWVITLILRSLCALSCCWLIPATCNSFDCFWRQFKGRVFSVYVTRQR